MNDPIRNDAYQPRCRCGEIMLGPGIAHCCAGHETFPNMDAYDAHLEVVGRYDDGMPKFRCRTDEREGDQK